MNGVKTLGDNFDSRQQTVQKIMQDDGYQTAHRRKVASWAWGYS